MTKKVSLWEKRANGWRLDVSSGFEGDGWSTIMRWMDAVGRSKVADFTSCLAGNCSLYLTVIFSPPFILQNKILFNVVSIRFSRRWAWHFISHLGDRSAVSPSRAKCLTCCVCLEQMAGDTMPYNRSSTNRRQPYQVCLTDCYTCRTPVTK